MKIHEYNEMMAYLTRPAMKMGGRIGYGVGDIVRPIPRVGKVYAAGEKIINIANLLKNKTFNFFKDKKITQEVAGKGRDFVRNLFKQEQIKNPELNKVFVSSVNKSGDIKYGVTTPDGKLHGSNLEEIISKRDNYYLMKEKPLRDKGYISSDEAAKFLRDKGFHTRTNIPGKGFMAPQTSKVIQYEGSVNADPIVKSLSNMANRYNMDIKQGPGYGGKQIFIKKSDLEKNVFQMIKDYLPKEDKIKLAKKLVEDYNIKSFNQLKKVLNKEFDSVNLSNADMKEYFPNLRQSHYTDKDFVPSATPSAFIQKVRREKIKEYGGPNVEKALIAFKKNLGFGQETQLMHPLTKIKTTKSVYEPEDLMFGSKEENFAYNRGLEKVRDTVQNTLKKFQSKYSPSDFEKNITIEIPEYLRRDYDFPKTMPIKKYTDRLNYMLTDLSTKTDGKIRGALFDESKWKFVESKLGVDYSNVPGMGLVEDNLKLLDPLFKKLKYDRSKGYEFGELLFDNKGMPLVKEGKKLTQDEADTLVSFLGNMKNQVSRSAGKEPVTLDVVKEIFERIPRNKGGRVGLAEGTSLWDKTKSVGGTTLRGLERATGPLGTELLFLLTGTKPDPTKSVDLLLPAFWNQIVEKYGWTSKLFDKDVKLKKRILDLIKRGGIPKAAIPAISRISQIGLGYTVPADLRSKPMMKTIEKAQKADVPLEDYITKDGTLIAFKDELYDRPEMNKVAGPGFGKGPYEYNQGGRVGLKEGSPKSPGRRAFIKGVTALAALPIVGKYFKLGKVLSKVGTYTGPAIQKIKGMPEWFPSLVKRLWNEGEDVTKQVAYGERQVVKRGTLEGGDDVDMIYDMDTGDVSISVTPKKGEYSTKSGAYNKEYELDYVKGQADETTKGKKPPDDFSVSEIEGTADPYAMDVNWEGKVTTVDDAMTDLTELEAFAKDKTTKQIHKKKGTKPKDVFPDYDPY